VSEHDPDFETKVGKPGRAVAQLPDPRQMTFLDILDQKREEENQCQRSDKQATPSTPSK